MRPAWRDYNALLCRMLPNLIACRAQMRRPPPKPHRSPPRGLPRLTSASIALLGLGVSKAVAAMPLRRR